MSASASVAASLVFKNRELFDSSIRSGFSRVHSPDSIERPFPGTNPVLKFENRRVITSPFCDLD
jgi:hypothetical protein